MPLDCTRLVTLAPAVTGGALLALGVALLVPPVPAHALESAAPRVALLDGPTGTLLVARDTGARFAPGNFTKLMTAAVVFEALDAGEVTEATLFKVSEQTWRRGGAPAGVTTMFAAVKSEVAVGDLLKGLIVDYGNDAALALAEGLAGSDQAFAARMNELSARIGLANSHFANPTGFPETGAHTTLDDVLKLTDWLQTRHADRYQLYRLPEFAWNRITQRNKTRQVADIPGTDGLVLAYEESAGFGGVISVLRNERRVTIAVSGLKSLADRDRELRRLAEGAFSEFSRVELYPAHAEIGTVRLFGAEVPRVAVTGAGDSPVAVTLPSGDRSGYTLSIAYDGPIAAPVAKGQIIARLEIRQGNRLYLTTPLAAAADVGVGDLRSRALDGLRELLFGWW